MTTPMRLADRIAAIAGSVDLSGFTPFWSPVMFLNENLWPTMTLMVSLAAILLTSFVMVGWCRGSVHAGGNSVIVAPQKAPGLRRSPYGPARLHTDPDAQVRRAANGELATMIKRLRAKRGQRRREQREFKAWLEITARPLC